MVVPLVVVLLVAVLVVLFVVAYSVLVKSDGIVRRHVIRARPPDHSNARYEVFDNNCYCCCCWVWWWWWWWWWWLMMTWWFFLLYLLLLIVVACQTNRRNGMPCHLIHCPVQSCLTLPFLFFVGSGDCANERRGKETNGRLFSRMTTMIRPVQSVPTSDQSSK